jgi:hypothetical protein
MIFSVDNELLRCNSIVYGGTPVFGFKILGCWWDVGFKIWMWVAEMEMLKNNETDILDVSLT